MSEDSLLADVESTPTEEATETTTETTETAPWFVSDGVEGSGDKPDFMLDKYTTLSDQAKAYPELASKLGGFTGAPENYESTMPEGIDGEIAGDDPLMGEFQDWAQKNQLNQEAFTDILHMFVKNEHANMGQNREAELAAIGDNAQERLQHIVDFSKANLSEDEYAGILEATTTAAGVKAIEALISQTRSLKVPDNSETTTGPSKTDIRERMSDPRYASDPDYRKATDAMWTRIIGTGEQRTVIG